MAFDAFNCSVLLIPAVAVVLVTLVRRRSAHDGIKEFISTVLLACLPAGAAWLTVLLVCGIVRDPRQLQMWVCFAVVAPVTFVMWREVWDLIS